MSFERGHHLLKQTLTSVTDSLGNKIATARSPLLQIIVRTHFFGEYWVRTRETNGQRRDASLRPFLNSGPLVRFDQTKTQASPILMKISLIFIEFLFRKKYTPITHFVADVSCMWATRDCLSPPTAGIRLAFLPLVPSFSRGDALENVYIEPVPMYQLSPIKQLSSVHSFRNRNFRFTKMQTNYMMLLISSHVSNTL